MRREVYSLKSLILMGGALFSMHFGAASMIYPMTWGKESGSSVIPAFLGVFLTGVFFPLLAYIALSNGKGSFYQITSYVSPGFAKFLCSLTIVVLGPFLLIPRMSAAAWEAFLQITGYQASSLVPIAIFSLVYYLIVYWFASNREKTVDRLSKLLLPFLLILVFAIFTKGFIDPSSSWQPKVYEESAFAYGFLQGYGTFELPCALIFGIVMINTLKHKGVDEKRINPMLMKIGLIGTGLLTITHLGHMLIGASTGNMFPDLQYSSLYVQVVMELWGSVGGLIFSFGLLLAALASATGISTATTEFVTEVTNGKVSYKLALIATLGVSALVSLAGLDRIITLTTPLLKAVYPPAIVLTLYFALVRNLISKSTILKLFRFGVVSAFVWGAFECIVEYLKMFGIKFGFITTIFNIVPLSNLGLGWVTIVIVATIAAFIYRPKPISS